MKAHTMRLDVVVPSVGRPATLTRCLGALANQTRQPDRVIVVLRPDDTASRVGVTRIPTNVSVEIVTVDRPGLVAALAAGLAAATAEVVAFTDDDAVPRTTWLECLARHYGDPSVAGVGGRDVVHTPGGTIEWSPRWLDLLLRRPSPVVGRLSRYGRLSGYHHLGVGTIQHVDCLKGANMSVRRDAGPKFDARIRGSSAQRYNELSLFLPLRAGGWRLVYDPEVCVDHYPGERLAGDDRAPSREQIIDATHNETFAVWEFLSPPWRVVFVLWAALVGTKESPGVVAAVAYSRQAGFVKASNRFMAAQTGRLLGYGSADHTPRLTLGLCRGAISLYRRRQRRDRPFGRRTQRRCERMD